MFFRRKTSSVAAGQSAALPETELTGAQENTVPGKKILVVDDDPVILTTLSLKLQSKGYQVLTASDGPQAIGVTRKEKPDLMLLDVCFPPDVAHGGGVPWDGFVITQWLRGLDHSKHIPVILISGADRAEYTERASAVGATAFFRKPIDNDQLLASIDTALCGHGGGKPRNMAASFSI
jgi:CheY-like chemotaxis protein